ncbi:sugar phosphate isomerase/epimerase [candidate division KSB1 bacterium]|nr:sugar phosphate isomerase/epimerase [candidate division KSB1 bacterium]
MNDLSRFCINTITTKPWSLEQAVEKYAAVGVKGITIWREMLENHNLHATGQMIRDHDMEIVSLSRGGFFAADTHSKRQEAIEQNRRIIEQAAELGAPMLVLVCGAVPGQSLEISRGQIRDGIEQILLSAIKAKIKLAIEPLHPVYAADQSAINTLRQANEMVERIDSTRLGVIVDTYHSWWDPALEPEITRCGLNNNLFGFHISDWKCPMTDPFNDRGLMGEGVINIPEIRSWVERVGFTGFNEVEILSQKYWERNQDEFLEQIKEAYIKFS